MGLDNVGDVNQACIDGKATDLIQVAEALQEKKIVQIAGGDIQQVQISAEGAHCPDYRPDQQRQEHVLQASECAAEGLRSASGVFLYR